jgi:opacity protein-like surface antigen
MKKLLLTLAILTSMSYAQETDTVNQGLYVGAGLGILATDDKGSAGIGLSLKAGVSLDETLKGFGLQLELNKSISDPENANHKDIDLMTMAAYTTFDITIPNSKVALRPRIGVILPNLKDDIDSRDVILSSGFGMTYALQDNMRLYADYTVLGESISNYSAGLEIKF